ncbi:MAG TPA: ATPase, T2SS/T4P/T4SS family [Burkholderiaceae bacterium]|nr:ATPase, T2SS/T4P/T4SS family [Burkholderiaceae bacterium]
MLGLVLSYEDGVIETRDIPLPFDVGRATHCGVCLRAWRVARRHARFYESGPGVMVEDFGSLCGTQINGRRITQYGPLCEGDEILVGPCLIRVTRVPNSCVVSPSGGGGQDTDGRSAVRMPGAAQSGRQSDQAPTSRYAGDNASAVPNVDAVTEPEVSSRPVEVGLRDRLRHRRRLHGALLEALDLRRRDIAALSDEALREQAREALAAILASDTELPKSMDQTELLSEVLDEAVGLGPLEPLLADPGISEIMVNRHDEIFVERAGALVRHDSGFSSEQAVLGVIERIVSPLGRRIDESSPMVDARLRDGSRVNAVIPPVALRGASLTIRKFPQHRPRMADLVALGSLDVSMQRFLEVCVARRKNILVSGGTGSGKTTLLNVLSNAIPVGERIVTIEDAAELRLNHAHLVSMESRPANLEGSGRIEIRDLVRNALRMRPDRIVIGECRGAEAFDMLAAMNTGHEGSLTTLHANSPRDALSRLETMILMAGMDLPLAAVREHVAASIDLIVQQARFPDGHRAITSIVEVTGIESGRIQLQELFRLEPGEPRVFAGCGMLPDFFSGHVELPCELDLEVFRQRHPARCKDVPVVQVHTP